MYINCSLTRLGKVEKVVLTRTRDHGWDVALHVDCGLPDGELMVLSRTSQTHMFHLIQTQVTIRKLLDALADLESADSTV
jgi:hypothetical protein